MTYTYGLNGGVETNPRAPRRGGHRGKHQVSTSGVQRAPPTPTVKSRESVGQVSTSHHCPPDGGLGAAAAPLRDPDGSAVGCLPHGKACPTCWPLRGTALEATCLVANPSAPTPQSPSPALAPRLPRPPSSCPLRAARARVPPASTASVAHLAPSLPLLAVSQSVSTFLLPCLCRTFGVAQWDG